MLYSDLSAHDRNAIVRELEAANVAYSVNDSTGEIQVGSKEVGRVRMLLAQKGLPEGGSIGYEIFDKESGLGTTRFDQDIKQQRAIEGESGEESAERARAVRSAPRGRAEPARRPCGRGWRES